MARHTDPLAAALERIEAARDRADMSQRELAGAAGRSPSWWDQVVSGKIRNPKRTALVKAAYHISEELGDEIAQLLGEQRPQTTWRDDLRRMRLDPRLERIVAAVIENYERDLG